MSMSMFKPLGSMVTSQATRKLLGGPQSLLPSSPHAGQGMPVFGKGLTHRRARNYVTARQNPMFSGLKNFGKGFR